MPVGTHGRDVVQRTGTLIRAAIVTVTAALTVTLVPHTAEARPHDPGDAAIAAAQKDRNRKAADVGRLTALVAQADGDARRAQDRAELAVERYNKAVVDLDTATTKAAAAKANVEKSARAVESARADFTRFARGSYMQGSTVGSSTTALLDANSPTDLLQRADLLSYAGKHKLDVMGQLERANVKRANAESTARQLLAAQRAATARAEQLKLAAARAVAAARAKLATLQTQKATLNQQLEAARIKLNGLVAERARYRAWKKAQEEAAAREAARQRALRAAAAAREAAAAAASSSSSSSSGSSSGSSRSVSVPRWTGGGGWSASKGQRVADLAMRWLGLPYSWGGGNFSGPTWGTDGPVGFDCSGLALWAWAQVGVYLPHYSGYQYRSGRHISRGNLMPGDLVFWAYDPSDPGTIHHVAIYIGGDRIVQAPQTGDVVKISYMWSGGYIGAARPGT
jgi:cell wall-associated NlpC family hydrolase